ncbi:T9SS type A sorting domain-containing protein [Flammeovirga pectinis]|uniref:T9SS type A sorting domain-containing protein n=1 Tax=Flammeovirga pectinis TaxID=2494373 RepID=A0A3Q9FNI4_9BACT|nr:T9SS type A sorting domain-containing protein [Flammeovirga pectinis]AZQ61736.1 T9SS type A sorting domain-containing protein [Flammeovirga pectinis]
MKRYLFIFTSLLPLLLTACTTLQEELLSFEPVELVKTYDIIVPHNKNHVETLHGWYDQDILVETGGTLKLNGNGGFLPGTKLHVQEGGKLEINTSSLDLSSADVDIQSNPNDCAVEVIRGDNPQIHWPFYDNSRPYSKGCIDNDLDLPVELVSFTTHLVNNTAQLAWVTASESNSKSFEVQRSTDNKNWVTIAEIKAAGNSNVRIDYTYTDKELPNTAIVYYRLNQLDLDGRTEIYGPNAIHLKEVDQEVLVYPNPIAFNKNLNILSTHEGMSVRIYDSSGRTYTEFETELNHATLKMIYGKGMLMVEVQNGKSKSTHKIIVN